MKQEENKKYLKEGFVGQKMLSVPEPMLQSIEKSTPFNRFYLTDLGFYPNAEFHYRKRKKGARQYILIYCVKGHGQVKIKEKIFSIQPNNFIIIPSKIKHEYSADKNNPWSIYWIHFTGETSVYLYNRYKEINNNEPCLISFNQERLDLFEKIYNLLESNLLVNVEYANLLSLGLLGQFIYHLLDLEEDHQIENTTINAVIQYLNQNLNKRLTLKEVAKRFNYSVSHLHAKFKRKTGYAMLDFFNLKKIQKACELLNYTDKTVKEISFEVGFDNPLYFSRVFKKYMGKSPRNYRKNLNI